MPAVARAVGVVVVDAVLEAGPVMTSCPGCKPRSTTVFVLSVLPVWIATRPGAPFWEDIHRGATAGLGLCIPNRAIGNQHRVVVLLGNDGHRGCHAWQQMDSRKVRGNEHAVGHHVGEVVPAGIMVDTVPVNVWLG